MPPEPALLDDEADYVLEAHVGYLLRLASQRHLTIFAAQMPEQLTPTQFSALQRLRGVGPCSQNRLGRLIAVDAATIKGVVERLAARGLVQTGPDPGDARRLMVRLTAAGEATAQAAIPAARRISAETLAPLRSDERATLLALLRRLQ